jgi:hypothetical protein
VALGASNLTRGFPSVVDAARRGFGPRLEVLAALGLGRSYGLESRVLGRTLPGILQCGLWRALADLPAAPARALVTDVGNDIGYGASATEILGWVEEVVQRLQGRGMEVVLAGLPLSRLRDLSPALFHVARAVLFPSSRRTLGEIREVAAEVEEGLAAMAGRRALTFFPLERAWYGLDPIHFRPRVWPEVWGRLTCGFRPPGPRGLSARDAARLLLAAPESRRLFGRTRTRSQPTLGLAGGTTIWSF